VAGASGAPEAEALTALQEGRAADERWHLRQDGTRFFASGVLTPLGNGGSRGFVKVARDLTDRKRMEDALHEARDELERRVVERTAELERANAALREAMAARTELLRRLVTAQEDERRRISRELHDGLGQELTALILGLKALEHAVPEGAPGRDRLREVERVVNAIGREAHDLAVELRPTALDDLGLVPALSEYVGRWSERTGVAAGFQPLGLEDGRLPPEVETAVYRVVQEALNNVAKHAGAGRVSVMVSRQGGELVAVVEDDGRGFDPGRAGSGGRRSLGLLGMRERVGLVGGALVVESAEGAGTTVQARIPLHGPSGEAGHGG
jgi:signal transduction histidine kinase